MAITSISYYIQGPIKASAGPIAVAEMQCSDKLLKDAFCISFYCSTPTTPLMQHS